MMIDKDQTDVTCINSEFQYTTFYVFYVLHYNRGSQPFFVKNPLSYKAIYQNPHTTATFHHHQYLSGDQLGEYERGALCFNTVRNVTACTDVFAVNVGCLMSSLMKVQRGLSSRECKCCA
ncbi:hypothetical protein E2C01_010658 [Portunus trituberculatus]|uniref:Uncharacterized protein n=1 Tax=Portunus trituberculatus TaxID=210409 RepID=A0A5B7D989_PORTR|nr:hypothetical protein [Portunus trituberculatus]